MIRSSCMRDPFAPVIRGAIGASRGDPLTRAALAVLQSFGTDAHLWLPGVGQVNGITAANFVESNGTVAAAVNDPIGYVGNASGNTITATQGTTANKPLLRQASGRFSWEFDGSNDRLTLSAAPFVATDSYAVVFSSSISASGTLRALWHAGVGSSRAGTVFYSTTLGVNAIWRDDAGTNSTSLSLGTVVLNTPFVSAVRKTGTSVIGEINATNRQTGSTAAHGATGIAAPSIGSIAASTYHIGNIGPVIAIKGTVNDDQLLTLERWVGSLSGVTIP
jgi:hypothetical protein